MKKNIIWILCFIPLLCFANVNSGIEVLKSQLQSINQERKLAREKADKVFLEYEKGEVDEDEIDDAYEILEDQIKVLNTRKQTIETQIRKLEVQGRQRLIDEPTPVPMNTKPEAVPPPSGIATSTGAMIAELVLLFERIFIGFIALLVFVFCIGVVSEINRLKKQKASPPNAVQVAKLHSGRIPAHLL